MNEGPDDRRSTLERKRPSVSVVIPLYNHEKFVVEAVDSVAAQGAENCELLMIDDGSRDSSDAIVRAHLDRWGAVFPRVYYRSQENRGVLRTVNLLLKEAEGEFVLLFASDDVLLPGALQRLLNALIDHGPGTALACGDAIFIDEKSRRLYPAPDGSLRLEPTPGFPASFFPFHSRTRYDWRTNRFGTSIIDYFGTYESLLFGSYMPTAVLVRRKALEEVGFWAADKVLEDWPMWLKLSKQYAFTCVPDVTAAYRRHGDNAHMRDQVALRVDVLQTLLSEREYCRKTGRLDAWYLALASMMSLRNPPATAELVISEKINPLRFMRAQFRIKTAFARDMLLKRLQLTPR